MTETLKILGQLTPAATTLSDLYAVPGGTSASISSIIVCNQNASSISFRISLAAAGAADNSKQYLYHDLTLLAHDTFIATIGISLASTDVVRVYASSGNVSFNICGIEVS